METPKRSKRLIGIIRPAGYILTARNSERLKILTATGQPSIPLKNLPFHMSLTAVRAPRAPITALRRRSRAARLRLRPRLLRRAMFLPAGKAAGKYISLETPLQWRGILC